MKHPKFSINREELNEDLVEYLRLSEAIPGWTRAEEADALAQAAYAIQGDAQIVEIGSFLGSSTVFLAGSRKLKGAGRVHCVDPFDASGDPFSVSFYREIIEELGSRSPLEYFEKNLRDAGVRDWVEVHRGRAEDVAVGWTKPIDLLIFDGNQSPVPVRAAYTAWSPWLKPGGVIALHNSAPLKYAPEHDGHYLLAKREIHAPRYRYRERVASMTFARQALPAEH